MAFRWVDCETDSFKTLWADYAAQIAVALVETPLLDESVKELRSFGVAPEHLPGAALGLVSLRSSGVMGVLASSDRVGELGVALRAAEVA